MNIDKIMFNRGPLDLQDLKEDKERKEERLLENNVSSEFSCSYFSYFKLSQHFYEFCLFERESPA